jgi:hypothetical protein
MHHILGIVNLDEVQDLKDVGKLGHKSHDFSHKIIEKVAKRYQSAVDDQELILSAPSYWRVETRPKGHKWHYDGCKEENGELVDNHMAWCRIGTSALLSNPDSFTGGELKFLIDDQEVIVHNHYLSGVMYSAGKHDKPLKHKVEPHKGDRTVLLMFFATKPVSKDQLKGN